MLNASRLRIIAIGKIRKPWIEEGIKLYLKRIPGITITELRDSNASQESELIKKNIQSKELLITLCEEGLQLTSISLAKQLQNLNSHRIAFVIGGADGLSPEIKRIAYTSMSLSPLTFPHEIARLLLVEQLYRANSILQGSPYHRN